MEVMEKRFQPGGLKSEIRRKLFHMVVVVGFIPIAALSKGILILIIVSCLILYLLHESYTQGGKTVPFFTDQIRKVKRLREEKIALSPFLMGGGIVVTVLVFHFKPAAAGLLQLAFGDMAAALVGMTWGKRRLPWSPEKSLEGALAFFATGIILMPFLFFPIPVCLLLAATGTLIESLPFKDWDNLLIPVGVAAVASFF